MAQKYDAPQGPPPGYPQAPQAVYQNPAYQYAGSPPPQQGYYNVPPQNEGYYGNPQGPYPPQGPYGQGYPPPQGMYYQQGPPPGGYYDDRGRGGAGSGLMAGLMAALACCCCLDCLF